jgi:hypothetical protein
MSGPFVATYITLWIVVVVQFVGIFALYHHFGQMYLGSPEGREAQGPRIEAKLKATDTRDLAGDPLVLPTPSKAAIMVFASTQCPLCDKLRPQIGQFADAHRGVETLIICSGERAAVLEWASGLPTTVRVIPDPAHRIARHYDVLNLPFCVGVDDTGLVRIAGVVNTRRGLEEAIELVEVASATGRQVGVPVLGISEVSR